MKKLSLSLSLILLSIFSLQAQFSIITNNLVNPAGIQADAAGNIWVAETGTGANDGRIVAVTPSGNKIPVVTGLPSALDPASQEIGGAWRSMFLENNQLAVVIGEGPTAQFGRIVIFNMAGFQLGVSAAKTLADVTKSIEISSFSLAQAGVTNSNPFSAAQDESGNWYVADAGANMIVKVTTNGQRSIFAKLPRVSNYTRIGPPTVDPVPTKIIAKKGGGFFVSQLTGFPFTEGKSKIYWIDANGIVRLYTTGMTLVTDLAYDDKTGDLYALQFGSFVFPSPGFVFGSGKVWRIRPGGRSMDLVAQGFGPGSGMTLDNQGNLYVTSLFTAQLLKMNSVLRSGISDDGLNLQSLNNNASFIESKRFETSPNPASDYLNISWNNQLSQTPQYMRLIDVTGRIVFEKNDLIQGTFQENIDLKPIQSGIYIVQLGTTEGVESRKVVVHK